MPLSEHEQRLLEQLEKQLHEDDPRFASSMETGAARRWSTRHLILGVLAAIVGILVLLVGVSTQLIIVGVLGFLVMGAGVYFATLRPRGAGKVNNPSSTGTKPRSSFMNNLEERWDARRREEP
ncbi:DUF3040 domain-containing protein [Pseudarthrobacter sp. J1738]|uniref:DUF3040 domain-containing protein n=1 Tax=unclassified Pseudarthrobacter TaxID=2647000 RepID=UPI003D29F5C0